MKLLIIHNILWSHYKNALFSELHKQCQQNNISLQVLQIARNEVSRASFENTDKAFFNANYPYTLLFDDFSENIPLKEVFKAILKQIRVFNPDVVNITGFYTWVHLAIIAYCKFSGIKVIMSNDSTRGDNVAVGWKEILKKKIISWCSGFFCFGTLAKEYMLALGAKPAQILAVHCGVVENDKVIELFEEAKQSLQNQQFPKNNFIYVGRFFEHKNLLLLLKAFQKANKNIDWGLILLGGGVQQGELEQFSKENALKNVFLVEGKPWYEVPQFLAISSVLVLPSKSEPWGLVVNEAMACKMPVIVSDKCGCHADLVAPSKNGFVFKHDSEDELSKYLTFFIENPAEIEKMGANSYEIIQQYSPQKAVGEMIHGLKKLQNENS